MLIILVGQNTDKRLVKQNEIVKSFAKNNAQVIEMTDANYDLSILKDSAGNAGLFGERDSFLIKGIDDDKEMLESFFENISTFVDSETKYLLSISKLLAPFVKKAEKAGAEIFETKEATKEKKYESFNIFNLTDAFSTRNRSQTWALYLSAIQAGLDSREIAGKFFWATKTMLVAKNSLSAKESGLHEFVYKKSKANAGNFKEGELENISYELTKLFHSSMIEGFDLEIALESFILKSLAKQVG